jgi:hypothetical protein
MSIKKSELLSIISSHIFLYLFRDNCFNFRLNIFVRCRGLLLLAIDVAIGLAELDQQLVLRNCVSHDTAHRLHHAIDGGTATQQ